ncbi:ATP-binding protein [Streptomyces sp. JJ66]|uniref:ATP-binding protein n=1 Tax=Streptomyces sp. JJ66 TaxID=2803843 RepID=UPI001C56806A|nr:ATP-binding protein [Streptomyces sp. JJ66]MBW1602939.1 ATP-binding protein [Streptomyces sp. JJ66]
MSFTRRIAKSALLTAAGAASVVGAAAGSAQAVQLPASDLGGVSNLDADSVGEGVDGAARNVTELAGQAGGEAVEQAVPAAGRTVGALGKATLPMAQNTAGSVAGESGALLGKAVSSVGENGLPAGQPGGLVPLGTDSLGGPVAGLPLL